MARYGIISDIHANAPALSVVLEHIGRHEVDEIICLGDVVGYGPDPERCIDLVHAYCGIMVRGNHDEAVLDAEQTRHFNGPAREAIDWTRQRLGPTHLLALSRMKSRVIVEGSILCVHDTPVEGASDYLYHPLEVAAAFAALDVPVALVGHTHVPVVFEAPGLDHGLAVEPVEVMVHEMIGSATLPFQEGLRYIANPGSVGQPRDGDPRASFAVLDTGEASFMLHRVEYDIASVQRSTGEAGLPDILAERLAAGV